MAEGTVTHISSPAERARRYRVLREAMAAEGMDALIIYSRADEFMRGRIQYVSDGFQWAGWGIIVLLPKGDAIYVGDPLWGGGRVALAGWVDDIRATQTPDTEIAGILSDHGYTSGKLGIVGLADIVTYAHMRAFQKALSGFSLVDATDLFDDIRAIKSPEEMENLRETSRILKQVFRSLEAHMRPGVLEIDAMAEAERLVRQYGCLTGIAQIARPPFKSYTFGMFAEIESHDIISIDLEWGGPSGYWLELRRNYSFGKPSDQVKRFFEIRLETLEACIAAMKTGGHSMDIVAARDRVNDKYGYGGRESVGYTAHGIGLDSLEPPWAPGKDRILETDMVINLHPHLSFSDPAEALAVSGISLSDNIRVTPTGGERMTDWTDELVDLNA